MSKKNTNVFIKKIFKQKNKYKITIRINDRNQIFFTKSIFENSLKNILAAITIISVFRDTRLLNKDIFYRFNVPNGRGDISKIKTNKKVIKFIDESYNANPLSVNSALKNFDLIKQDSSKKHLILGDMLQLGKHSQRLHEKLAKNINASKIDYVYVYGNEVKRTYNKISLKKRGSILRGKNEIISLIKNNINNNDYLMIKGSNSTGLNKIAKNLKKGILNAL